MTKKHANSSWLAMQALQEKTGHEFRDCDKLSLALTHSSWANEHNLTGCHNQRLEFLGDAVLELCVSDALYERFPDAREGVMTEMRAKLVSEAALAEIARGLGLDQALRLGRGEELQDGRHKDSLLADAFEAVLAAIYLDGGFAAAKKTVDLLYAGLWPRSIAEPKQKDPKSMLQELCQKRYRGTPAYSLAGVSGPEHARIFDVKLVLPDGREFTGRETSAKKAEQTAAANALKAM